MQRILMRFPGGLSRALTLSYDDGSDQDVRLIQILRDHGLKATINLNSGLFAPEGTVYPAGQVHRRMTKDQSVRLYTGSGMEIAVHGLHHPYLEQLPQALLAREILEDRKNLEDLFGGIVRGMAYPYGTYSPRVVDALRALDIAYARTVRSTHGFALPQDWLLWDPTCSHLDPELMPLARRFLDLPSGRPPMVFYLWGHSYEFERDGNWPVIEEFAGLMGRREDIWYAANIEIHDYVEAFRRLQSSADGTRFHNPTALPLFFETESGAGYAVQPGQTLDVD